MGLTEKEAVERLKKQGENKLADGKRISAVGIFFQSIP